MSKKIISKPLTIAMGAALVGCLAGAGSVSAGVTGATADANPFAMEELSSGYLIAGEEGSCGEGKCGEDKDKDKDSDEEGGEGSCGGSRIA